MEMTMWFFFLIPFMHCIMFVDLYILSHPCIPERKPT
jgi:hypothetical protein